MEKTTCRASEEHLACGQQTPKLAVVVPCYRVRDQIAAVLEAIGPEVWRIYCVHDGCPEQSGDAAAAAAIDDSRFRLLRHPHNCGVGAAVVTGYKQALKDGADVIIKLDGDGQLDPAEIPRLVAPILRGEADYVKGNRFFYLDDLHSMPWGRLIGNAGLSFLTKLSSGYWHGFDPTNGFTAIHAAVARQLPLERLSRRFFFESDILFRLNTIHAVVEGIPIRSLRGETQQSAPAAVAVRFSVFLHARNFFKRVFYNYFLRDFSIASVNLVMGTLLIAFGLIFGLAKWIESGHRPRICQNPSENFITFPPLIRNMVQLDIR